MRHINIDLTSENTRTHNGKFVGNIGEHNATELLLTIPQIMIDESDYCVVLFQSGLQTFRSRKIFADSNATSAYRIDNCIHCQLGSYLTREPILGVQVECYRTDENGSPELISKSPFASRLMLKPSPQGYPGFGYDGSYEDVQNAIELAHNHSNFSSLVKIGENEEGHFIFDGREISGGGIASYHDFNALPDNAENGTIVRVENDLLPQTIEPIILNTTLPRICVESNPEGTALDDIPLVFYENVHEDNHEIYQCDIDFVHSDNGERLCGIQLIYSLGIASLVMFNELEKDRIERAYVPGGNNEYPDYPSYLYNFIDGFDASVMTGEEEPRIFPSGWYRINEKRINFRAAYGNLEYDSQIEIDAVDFEDTPLADAFRNCAFEYNTEDLNINEAKLSAILSKLFRPSSSLEIKKGLYVFDGGEWRRFKSSDIAVVENRLALADHADEGDIAVVRNSSCIFSCTPGQYVNAGSTQNAVHINPCLNALSKLYDIELSAIYGCYGTDENGLYRFIPSGGGGFEFISNIEEDYALLSISPYNWTSDREHYIYSWSEQTLQFSSGSDLGNSSEIEIPLSIGWNKVNINTSTGEYNGVSLVVDPNELPSLTIDSYGSTGYAYCYIVCSSTWFENRFKQRIVSDEPFFTSDNAQGLWGYYNGSWQKLENNLFYTYEYGDDR